MVNLTFADSHNMVAYLEKSIENADFIEIVDFLNASHIRYALTGTGSGSGPRHQDTILGDRPAQSRFKRLSKQSHKPPLSRVNTLRSKEDIMQLLELMELCIRFSDRVLNLENEDASHQGRNDQDKGILFVQDDTEVNTASIPITTASINIGTAESVSTVSTPVTTAGVSVSTAKPTSETTTRTTSTPQQQLDHKDKGNGKMVEPEKPLKKKDQITLDEEVARRLKAQMQAELEEEERLAR
nr:hypothetical protein [Tanacetum cinerariifolium]